MIIIETKKYGKASDSDYKSIKFIGLCDFYMKIVTSLDKT